MKEEHSPNWGGKRPRAGRKAGNGTLKKFPASFPIEHVEALDEIARNMGESRNSVLRRAVLAFLTKDEHPVIKAMLEAPIDDDKPSRWTKEELEQMVEDDELTPKEHAEKK